MRNTLDYLLSLTITKKKYQTMMQVYVKTFFPLSMMLWINKLVFSLALFLQGIFKFAGKAKTMDKLLAFVTNIRLS
jgi:hypothetical protein